MKPSMTTERVPIVGVILLGLASSLCCVLPFVLVSIGITGPWLARLRVFEPYRIGIDVASLIVLAIAWGSHVLVVRACRVDDRCGLPTRVRRTRIGLVIATVAVIAIIGTPYAISYFGGI